MKKLILTICVAVGLFASSTMMTNTGLIFAGLNKTTTVTIVKRYLTTDDTKEIACRVFKKSKVARNRVMIFIIPTSDTFRMDTYSVNDCK